MSSHIKCRRIPWTKCRKRGKCGGSQGLLPIAGDRNNADICQGYTNNGRRAIVFMSQHAISCGVHMLNAFRIIAIIPGSGSGRRSAGKSVFIKRAGELFEPAGFRVIKNTSTIPGFPPVKYPPVFDFVLLPRTGQRIYSAPFICVHLSLYIFRIGCLMTVFHFSGATFRASDI